MDGVTVLNEVEVVQIVNDTFNYTVAGIAFGVTVLICAIAGYFVGRCEFDEFTGVLLGILTGLVLGLFISIPVGAIFAHPSVTETHIHYEVTIDDSVSITEFVERYNIIEQRGSIFVIEEKCTDS